MRNFEYVPKEEYGPVKEKLIGLIKNVQYELRDYFTFQFTFIGSSSRNMITREIDGNRGYDFDVDIRVNDDDEQFSAEELKHILMNAINRVFLPYGFSPCEDSTRVITIKRIDVWNSRILYSCDFAIVNDYEDDAGNKRQQYVYSDKQHRRYLWVERSKEYCKLSEKERAIKAAGKWDRVMKVYLNKKCLFSYEKKSRSLYAETINEVFNSLSRNR